MSRCVVLRYAVVYWIMMDYTYYQDSCIDV